VNYWIKDTINTAYGEIDYLLPFGRGTDAPSYRISFNDLDQTSVGRDLIPGPPFNTFQASARLLTSYRGFVLTTAVSTVGRKPPSATLSAISPSIRRCISRRSSGPAKKPIS